MTRDELLRRASPKQTPEQTGQAFLLQLYMMTVVFFAVYFGLLGMIVFWPYVPASEIEHLVLPEIEAYLEGDSYFSDPFPAPYKDVVIGAYQMKRDVWATLRAGCSGGITRKSRNRCAMNFTYKAFVSYQADGKSMSGIFRIVFRSGEAEVTLM